MIYDSESGIILSNGGVIPLFVPSTSKGVITMNINFTSTHLETLCELKAIAEKHNCKINFGVQTIDYNEVYGELDLEMLRHFGFTDSDIMYINDYMRINHHSELVETVWFELIEKKADKTSIHQMSYGVNTIDLLIDRNNLGLYSQPDNESVIEKLEEHSLDYDNHDYVISESCDKTWVHGFGNDKDIEDNRVYRFDMALKYFADLVCDYLGEPRIERVYN